MGHPGGIWMEVRVVNGRSEGGALESLAVIVIAVVLMAAAAVRALTAAPVTPDGLVAPAEGTSPPVPAGAPATLLAAGDIADCEGGAVATGRLLDDLDGVVAALGDLAYPDGSADAFRDCFDPTWGGLRDRIRPAQGNHDVRTAGAAGYHDYFGELAGPAPQGYYSYDLGEWHVVVLNSNCAQVGGCDPGSPQLEWLAEDLAGATTDNIVAYWHHPRFSTGKHGDDPAVAPFWDVLHAAGADLVLNGHDHDYQRFVPLGPDGRPDPAGIRQFVVGTGGAHLREFTVDADTVAFRQDDHLGVLRLDLEACGYRWEFLPADGGAPLDTGEVDGTCD